MVIVSISTGAGGRLLVPDLEKMLDELKKTEKKLLRMVDEEEKEKSKRIQLVLEDIKEG